MKKIGIVLIVALMMVSLLGCQTETSELIFGEGNWNSNVFHDKVAEIIIEEGYGVEVTIMPADTAVMVSSMRAKDVDICMELWSDNVETYDEDIEEGYYVKLSVNYDDNTQGLYVPRYLVEGEDAIAEGLKTVSDLKDYVELFTNPEDTKRGIIYAGPEGWGATDFLHKKMVEYELDEMYDFKSIDSSDILAATLVSAYKKGDPWVGYYWEPTWVMGLYDMVLLEDSEYSDENYANGIGAFATVDVNVVAIPEVEEEYPEIYEFLTNYTTSSALTSEALAYMEENDVEEVEAAKWFLREHEELWKSWVTQDAYDKIVNAIEE